MYDFSQFGLRIMVCILVACRIMTFSSVAQINSSGYATVEVTDYFIEYPDITLRDNIYIFCRENGNLSASLDEVPGDLVFEWAVYDPLVPGFGAPFTTDTGRSSQVSGLESGGYQVRISNASGLDTLFRAWLFVNNPGVKAQVVRHDCQVLDLKGVVEVDTFFYYHPQSNEINTLSGSFTFNWLADPSLASGIANRLDPRIWNPPSVKTEYKLTINYHSCQASDTVTEDPVTTHAVFTLQPGEGGAPLEVGFDAGESQNAAEYEWYFDYQPGDFELGIPGGFTTDPVHTYNIPGEYYVLLRTISPSLCEDSLMYSEPIRVYPSQLEVPNVFSPGGDEYNNVFMVRSVSLKDFNGVIYNRNGRRVYEWTDPSRGWDGKVDGKLASPGVYFYLVTGVGWDDIEYEFTGPLYLYRGR